VTSHAFVERENCITVPFFELNVKNGSIFTDFIRLNLFFQIEAHVSPCLWPLVLPKYFGVKKRKKVNEKDYNALAPYPQKIPSNPSQATRSELHRCARAEP
jgi:hypothetical protein